MLDPRRVRAIFLEAVERHGPEERIAFLEQACGTDQDLRQRVAALLDAHGQANSMLDFEVGTAVTIDRGVESAGTFIGPYKLLELVGEGGFGLVYVAEQQRPVRRRVALK